MARLAGLSIRVHMFFWVFAASTVYFVWHAQRDGNHEDLADIAFGCLALLGLSLLVHEAAHVWVARRGGGDMDAMVIGPLIGLSRMIAPPDPRDEMLAHLAGPFANVLLALIAAAGLAAAGQFQWALLNPLSPEGAIDGTLIALKLLFWINWLLALLNLLPAFPFDGGRALRAAILWRAPQLGRRVASRRVTVAARLTASALLVIAIFYLPQQAHSALDWFALTLLAIFVFFSPEHDPLPAPPESAPPVAARPTPIPALRRSTEVDPVVEDDLHYDVFGFEDELADEPPVAGCSADATTVDERRVDAILIRVHEHGMDGLTAEEREFLQRASLSYRRRREHNVR